MRLTEQEMKTALDKCPPDLHRLLVWLVTGKTIMARDIRNGTA